MDRYTEKLTNCETKGEFRKLWDPEKFNWWEGSLFLCKYCSDYFHIWWDPDKFEWNYSNLLCMYCSDYINIWWDSDKFRWRRNSYLLCRYCSNYINIWWDPDKFNWWDYRNLFDYCYQYREVWYPDYLEKSLKGELN